MIARDELEEQTWLALRELVLERYDRRAEVAEVLGMSYLRAKALRMLIDGPMTMRELAAELVTDASYVTVLVDDLEEWGLVIRSPHPEDRRVKTVSSTAAGRRIARRAEKITNAPPAPMARLSRADLAALKRIIGELLAAE
jgi:DNA-binding MarR family transcriptional regulator